MGQTPFAEDAPESVSCTSPLSVCVAAGPMELHSIVMGSVFSCMDLVVLMYGPDKPSMGGLRIPKQNRTIDMPGPEA